MLGLNSGIFSLISMVIGANFFVYCAIIAIAYSAGVKNPKAELKMSLPELIIAGLILAPILEELIFRGPVWIISDGNFSAWTITVIISQAIIFGLLHTSSNQYEEINTEGKIIRFLITCSFGITFGWLVVVTGSLIPAMIAHFTVNFVEVCGKIINPKSI